MNILEEYERQQKWRNWENHFQHMPMLESDIVVDFGCAIGEVCRGLATKVSRVYGIDINMDFIDFCNSESGENEIYVCTDFSTMELSELGSISGVWSSFSLSYLPNPLEFLKNLYRYLEHGGWIALVDTSCFLSGNIANSSDFYSVVYKFEVESSESGLYDFDFGSKMKGLLVSAGFHIIYEDNDVNDAELNFDGAAQSDVLENWEARLQRMKALKILLAQEYEVFCSELLENLSSKHHRKNNNVKFVVAKKI